MISFLLVWVKKKLVSGCVEFPTSLMFDMPFGLSRYIHHAGIACSLRHPILSSSILNVILFGAIYHRLLVKPHPASPQPLPADVSTQRTKYKNHLTPMGWGGPLSFGRFKSVQHNQSTGHLILLTPPALLSLLHSFLILCSIGSPYFLFASFLSRGCLRIRFFLGWIS